MAANLGLRIGNTNLGAALDTTPRPYDDFLAETRRGGLSELSRGWKSTRIDEDAAALTTLGLRAEAAGDTANAAKLYSEAKALSQRAARWAPTVGQIGDVDSAGSAAEWALGTIGGAGASAVTPIASGIAGGLAGGAAGLAVGGPVGAALGTVGGALGAFTPSYLTMRDMGNLDSVMDPEVRAKRSAQEILDANAVGAIPQAALESVVPFGIGRMVAAPVGAAARTAIRSGAGTHIAKGLVREGSEEALTEGAQSVLGQTTQNYLAERNLSNIDLDEVINNAAAGFVGGGALGAGGRAIQTGRVLAGDAMGKTVDAARNPGRVIGDAIADGSALAGKIHGRFEANQKAKAFEEVLRSQPTITPEMTDEQANETVRQDIATKREATAGWVEEVLNDPDSSPADRDAATEIKARAEAGATNVHELAEAHLSWKERAVSRLSDIVTKLTGEGPAPKHKGGRPNAMTPDERGEDNLPAYRIERLFDLAPQGSIVRTASLAEQGRIDKAIDHFAKGAGTPETRKLLDELFGGPEVTERVLSMYREGQSESEAQINPVTNTKFSEGDLDERGTIFNEDGEKQNEARLDTSTVWEASHAKSGSYFDLKDEAQLGRFERAKDGLRNKVQTDSASVNVRPVGMIDREVEKLGENATPEMIEERKLEIVNDPKYGFPKLEAPKAPPAGNAVAAADYKKRRAQFEKELNRRVRAFNKRFQTLRADSEALDRGGMDFNEADVRDVQNKTDLRDASKASPVTGTLVLERADASKPFITSAPKLLGRMFKLGTEKNSTDDLNRPENLMTLFAQGIASLLDYSARGKQAVADFADRQSRGEVADDEVAPKGAKLDFTGRIGYVKYGKTYWLNDPAQGQGSGKNGRLTAADLKMFEALPDEFLIQARGGRITMGDVRRVLAEKQGAAKGKAAKSAIRMRDELMQLVQADEARIAKKKATKLNDEQTKRVLQAISETNTEDPNAPIASEVAERIKALHRELIGGHLSASEGGARNTDGLVPSEVSQTVDDMQVDLTPAETGLLAYGNTGSEKEAKIERDDRGFTKGDTAGYNTTGPGSERASKGKSRGEDNQSPATKATPERVGARDDSVDRIEYVAEQVRRGFGGFMQWFKTLNNEQKTAAVSALRLLKDMTLDGLRIAYNKTVDADTHKKLVTLAAKLEASIIEGPFARNLSDGPFAVDDEGRHYRESTRAKVGARNTSPVRAQKVRDGGGVRNAQNDRPVAEASQRPDAGAVAGGSASAGLNVWHGSGENAQLSNLASRPFTFEGRKYLSVEHAYQSLKSGDFDQTTYDKYDRADKKVRGNRGTKSEGDWNIKLMEKLVRASFDQNPDAMAALKATGSATITHSQDKGVWGKEFPRILMEVRDSSQAKAEPKPNAQSTGRKANAMSSDKFNDFMSKALGPTKRELTWTKESVSVESDGVVVTKWAAFDPRDQTDFEISHWAFSKIGGEDEVVVSVMRDGDAVDGWTEASVESAKESVEKEPLNLDTLDDSEYLNAQTPTDVLDSVDVTAAELKAALDEVKRLLGKDYKAQAANVIEGDNGEMWSGLFDKDDGIKIAAGALDKMGVGRHEALHQIFQWLREHGAPETIKLLQNIATNKLIMEKLKKELADHPGALAQLSDPEEAAAYLFQFWMAGKIQIGPKTETLFQQIVDLLNKLQLWVREKVFGSQTAATERQARAQEKMANKILSAMALGELANADQRANVIALMEKDAAAVANRRANTRLIGTRFGKIVQKALHTAGSIFEESANPVLNKVGKQFFLFEGQNQERQPFIESFAQQNDKWQVRLERILSNYSKETLELGHQYMNERRPLDKIHHPEAKAAVTEIRALLKEMYLYAKGRGTSVWDAETHSWRQLGEIKEDYYPRVWDIDLLMTQKGQSEFLAKMIPALEQHRRDGGFPEIEEFKAEVMADAILNRLINGQGSEGPQESGVDDIGISPWMAAVNRRELNWIKDADFAEFFSKEMTKTLTTYIAETVKRAEYTKAFGNGGENLRNDMMQAMVWEMGGDKLLERVEAQMEDRIKGWKQEVKDQRAAGVTDTPDMPTPLSVAREILREDLRYELAKKLFPNRKTIQKSTPETEAQLKKEEAEIDKAAREANISGQVDKLQLEAAERLEPATKAIMALEGTLGHNIDPRARHVLSAITTYQNFRLLPLALFASINDPVGIIVRGGEMSDAWNAFTRGLHEIKAVWKGEHTNDELAKLAEDIGIVSRTSLTNALGQTYSSQFMHGRLKAANDWFFRMNGLEAWNRAMRIQATGAAMGFIERHITKPNEHSQRYMEELFGEGYDAAEIMIDGKLNLASDKVQQGIFRWVNGAILRPNASLRPVYASDPHYQLFYHLKSFAYAMHKVILRRAWQEAKAGNMAPGAALLVGYVPVAIAADVVKETLLPDEDPAWMKMGLGAYLTHGVARAGLGGVPDLWLGDFAENPLKLYNSPEKRDFWLGAQSNILGPAPDQLIDALLTPALESKTWQKEALGALPGGVVARRAAD